MLFGLSFLKFFFSQPEYFLRSFKYDKYTGLYFAIDKIQTAEAVLDHDKFWVKYQVKKAKTGCGRLLFVLLSDYIQEIVPCFERFKL